VKRSLTFAAVMLVTAYALLGSAQPRKKPPPKEKDEAGISAREESRDGGKGAGVVDQKTGDGGSKVFRFGEVEVEGRLKSPQIVYFLRRVRAEFNAGDLGHRSFIRELDDTKNEPSF
jgi:hypothetical protein